jgi:hypothetical protein
VRATPLEGVRRQLPVTDSVPEDVFSKWLQQ